MCLIKGRIQRAVSSTTFIILLLWIIHIYVNANGKDSLLLRHALNKHFNVSFDHENKTHAPFLKTIWLPHILVLE